MSVCVPVVYLFSYLQCTLRVTQKLQETSVACHMDICFIGALASFLNILSLRDDIGIE